MRASLAASTITRSLIAPLAGPKTTATVLSSAIASACRLSDFAGGRTCFRFSVLFCGKRICDDKRKISIIRGCGPAALSSAGAGVAAVSVNDSGVGRNGFHTKGPLMRVVAVSASVYPSILLHPAVRYWAIDFRVIWGTMPPTSSPFLFCLR